MIRRGKPGDEAGLARVHVASWQAAYRGLMDQAFLDGLDLEARTAWWATALTRQTNLINVVVVEGSIAGFCLAGASTQDGWGEVYAIYVDPEHWGEGMGADLLRAGEADLAAAGHSQALLWVLSRNGPARAFYERQGWALAKPMRIESIGGADVTEVRYEKALGRL